MTVLGAEAVFTPSDLSSVQKAGLWFGLISNDCLHAACPAAFVWMGKREGPVCPALQNTVRSSDTTKSIPFLIF